MSTTQLEAALVDRLRRHAVWVPQFPPVAARLRELATAGVDPTELATVVEADPGLAARVIARAAADRPKVGGVMTLVAAITHLGIDELIGLAMSTELGRVAVGSGPLSALRRDAWRCALLSARIAQELAPARGVAPGQAYVAGLLHDFGAIVVIATLEDIARRGFLPALAETTWNALIGRMRVAFGLIAAVRWRLPASLVDVIQHHDAPTTPLARLIHLADLQVDALDHPPGGTPRALRDITDDECARICAAIPQVVEQMASLAPPSTQFLPVVVSAVDGEQAWPAAFDVQLRCGRFRATALTPSSVTFTCTQPLALNWLTELTVHGARTPISMLANVKRCVKGPGGSFTVTAQPYALGGAAKDAWSALVDQTRRAGSVSLVGARDDLPRLAL